jgi:hypothetical protein
MAKGLPQKSWAEMTQSEKVGLFVTIGLGLLLLLGCNGPPPKPKPPTDAEFIASLSGVDAARAQSVLSRLGTKYGMSDSEIAARTFYADKKLKEAGLVSNIVEIAEGLDAVIPVPPDFRYAEYCAGYGLIRKKGCSHSQACQEVRQAIAVTHALNPEP